MIKSRRFAVPVAFETHIATLAVLVAEAKRIGYAKAKLDRRFVQVVDYRHFAGREKWPESFAEAREQASIRTTELYRAAGIGRGWAIRAILPADQWHAVFGGGG